MGFEAVEGVEHFWMGILNVFLKWFEVGSLMMMERCVRRDSVGNEGVVCSHREGPNLIISLEKI